MPTFSVWDTWGDMFYPGGLAFIGMTGGYGRMIEALDLDQRAVLQEFPYFAGAHFAGPAPVDADADGSMVAAAIADHAANFDTTAFVAQLQTRDAAFAHDRDFRATLRRRQWSERPILRQVGTRVNPAFSAAQARSRQKALEKADPGAAPTADLVLPDYRCAGSRPQEQEYKTMQRQKDETRFYP